MWKNLFYFTRREKSGLLFLVILIGGIFAGKVFLTKPVNQLPENTEFRTATEDIRTAGNETGTKRRQPKENRPVSSRQPLTDKLLSYENSRNDKKQTRDKSENSTRTYFNRQRNTASLDRDSIRHPEKINKLKPGNTIDINTADTASMMQIPGIGKTYATRILKYRKLLGGYYSVEQLKEVYGMYEELYAEIIPFFEVTIDSITLIPVNKVSIDRLRSHPYIDFYQAKAIVELRKKNGKITHLKALSMLEEFSVNELEKIEHYLSFE